ncbi:MAG: hypothetical protein AAB425_14745 [Bdellovibrionota bacterium]
MNRIILLALIATAVAESTSVVQATESGSAAESGANAAAAARLPLRRYAPPFQVSGLVNSKDEPLEGRILQAFYVVARLSGIGTPGQTLKVRKIVLPIAKAEINEDGVATFPETSVPSYGDRICNFIIFALAKDDTQELYFRNSDGTFPSEDPRYPRIPPLKLTEKLAKLPIESFATEKVGYIPIAPYLLDELPKDNVGKILEIKSVELVAGTDLWPQKKTIRRSGGAGKDGDSETK